MTVESTSVQNTQQSPAFAKPMLVEGLSLVQWVENETQEVTKNLWGDEITFKPVICETHLGDGLQLIYVGTIGQRPYHWLMCIDSKTDLNASDFDIEEILEILEDEFGRQENYMSEEEFNSMIDEPESDFDNYEDWLQCRYNYPCIGWDGGYYGLIVNMVTSEVGS